MEELVSVLDSVGKAASQASGIPGPLGVVAQVMSIALRTASKVAASGADPVAAIQRIHSAAEATEAVEGDWSAAIKDRFGSTDPSGE